MFKNADVLIVFRTCPHLDTYDRGVEAAKIIIEMIKKEVDFNRGFDVRNEEYVDMIEAGIIDPQKVTATALKNAISVCNSLLSVGCVVLEAQSYEQGVQLVQLSDDMY